MKKTILVFAVSFLSGAAAWSQMGGGMMGGGMMGGGMMNANRNDTSQTPTTGAEVFESRCASCHGGGKNFIVPSLPLRGSRMLASFNTFLQFVRHPRMPDGSVGAMPAFTETNLSDQQAETLYQFIVAQYGAGETKK